MTDSCQPNSLSNLVTARLAEDASVRCGQEILFAALCVRDLLRELLGRARQIRLLARVVLELLHVDAFLRESKLDIAQVLLCIQSDLDAASSSADSLHVVFIEGDVDHILCTGHFLNAYQVRALWQIRELKIHNSYLVAGADSVVGLHAV